MSILKRASDSYNVQFDWTNALPTGVTVTSVVHTVPDGLTKEGESDSSPTSTVKVSGGKHGRSYQVKAVATLSNSEQVTDYVTLVVFNES
jgi:hypothetical protein